MFRKTCVIVGILLASAVFAFAAAQEESLIVKSSVDKNKVSLGQALIFRIEISDISGKAPEIKLPDLKKDFDILSSGQSQSISIGAKVQKQAAVFEYILSPKKAGKITIGAAEVKNGNEVYKTNPIDVEVTPSAEKLQPPIPKDEENPSEEEGTVI